MTEWKRIKVGGLYKRKESFGAHEEPLRMVLSLEPMPEPDGSAWSGDRVKMLSMLGEHVIGSILYFVDTDFGAQGRWLHDMQVDNDPTPRGSCLTARPWPYKEVA